MRTLFSVIVLTLLSWVCASEHKQMHTPAWRSEFLSMAESFELPDDSSDTEEHTTTSLKSKRRQGDDAKKNTQVSSSKKLKEGEGMLMLKI